MEAINIHAELIALFTQLIHEHNRRWSPTMLAQPGVFVVRHVPSDRYLLGLSRVNTRTHATQRFHAMLNKRTGNPIIDVLNIMPEHLEVYVYNVDTVDRAVDIAQSFFVRWRTTDKLFNTAAEEIRAPHLGKPHTAQSKALLSEKRSGWANTTHMRAASSASMRRLHAEGRINRTVVIPTRIVVDGVAYQGYKAACEALELSQPTLRARCLSPDPIYSNYAAYRNNSETPMVSTGNTNAIKPVSINGIVYPNLKEAASAVGFTSGTVRRRVLSDHLHYKAWFYTTPATDTTRS